MTSTSVGWVLLDGQGPDAATLDDDAFDVQSGGDAASGGTSPHAAAARGAQAIATASGYKVGAVHVTWTPDVEAGGTALLKSLSELGFDNVVAIPLSQAAQAWGIETGRANEHHKTALCVLEPDAATVMVIATGAGTVRTAVIDNRETTDDLLERLRTVFRKDGWLPESVHLVGSRIDLDEVAEPISAALPLPVSDTVDTQLALARGAALTTVDHAGTGSSEPAETSRDEPWRVETEKVEKTVAVQVPTEAAVTSPVSEPDTNSPETAETQRIAVTPRKDPPPRRERPWVVTHAKKLTISAAAIAAFGAALSLAAGSALNVENVSAEAANQPAGGASVTSASIHPVPAPVSAQPVAPVQPLAAEPPPPPEPLVPPAEPVVTVAPQPVSVPVPQHTVSAPPSAAPLVAPAPAAAPAPVVPPPAAPLAAPLPAEVPAPVAAPAPAAPPPAAPLAAPPAPIAPPAAPAPAESPPPPPPDPVQQVLSPLFSGLP